MGKYLIITVLVLGFFIWKSWYDAKTRRTKLRYQLKKQWGKVPKEEYTSEKFQSLGAYYRTIKNEKTDVDDITWNDIDMDEIFMVMNNTRSAMGEEYLYSMLHQLKYQEEDLLERERLIQFFTKNEDARIRIQEILSNMGKVREISVYEYMNRLQSVPKESNAAHYGMILSILAAVSVIFFLPPVGLLLTVVAALNNIVKYYKRKSEIEAYFTVVSYMIRMLDCVQEIESCNYPELSDYKEKLSKAKKSYVRFRKGARVVASKKPTGDILDVGLDYLRMIFHFDLIKFNSMINTFETKKEDRDVMFETIGFLDSMIAIASFRTLMDQWCIPEFVADKKKFLSVNEIYHPLLENPVKNSITAEQCVLITGSNASGKSTFIKTITINVILAQTIHTVMADNYAANYFYVASSMALTDNLSNHESYYIVEIRSLKRILDHINDKYPVLCFVDEVLRGTNTLERIAASSQILYSFAVSNAICFAATHDIELTHILENFYSNYHFQEQIENKEILFDYKLYEGRAISQNAIKLLGILGYSKEIISQAEKMAAHFLEYGEWEQVNRT